MSLIFAFCLILAGCGSKGALYLPNQTNDDSDNLEKTEQQKSRQTHKDSEQLSS